MKRNLLIVLGLVALTSAAFWGVRSCGFVDLDDDYYVVNNPHINGHLSTAQVKWAFTTFYQGNYLPLTWLSLILDARFFGLGPRGFHLTNAAFHAINVVLVYLWFRRATGSAWRSALVASIFAVHPLRVESVVWIVERKDVLTLFFGLLTMHAYLQVARSKKRLLWYLATILLYAAALLSKQTLATLPILLLLLDYWPLGRWVRGPEPANPTQVSPRRTLPRLILEKLPLLLLVVAISVVTMKAQSSTNSVVSLKDVPMSLRLQNMPVAYARYLGKMFWFRNLAVFYPLKLWTATQVTAAIVLLAAITVFVVWKLRSRPWLAIGWFWFLGVLVPMIGLVQFAGQAMADRFTYFSGIGILVMLAWSIPATIARRWPAATGAAAITLLGILSVFTLIQTSYWKNSGTLFGHDVAVAGSSMLAEIDLADYLASQGNTSEAIPHFRAAVISAPDEDLPAYDLAVALFNTNQKTEARQYLFRALRANPDHAKAHVLLANLFNGDERYKEAEREALLGIKLNPSLRDGYQEAGIALAAQGRIDEAMNQFKLEISVDPHSPVARHHLRVLELESKRRKG